MFYVCVCRAMSNAECRMPNARVCCSASRMNVNVRNLHGCICTLSRSTFFSCSSVRYYAPTGFIQMPSTYVRWNMLEHRHIATSPHHSAIYQVQRHTCYQFCVSFTTHTHKKTAIQESWHALNLQWLCHNQHLDRAYNNLIRNLYLCNVKHGRVFMDVNMSISMHLCVFRIRTEFKRI